MPRCAKTSKFPATPPAELLKQAPDPEPPYFRVPKVIERCDRRPACCTRCARSKANANGTNWTIEAQRSLRRRRFPRANWPLNTTSESKRATRTERLSSRFRKNAPTRKPTRSTHSLLRANRCRRWPACRSRIKDVHQHSRHVRTTCGSKILEHYVPPYDATAVTRLEAAGAVHPRQNQLRRICDGQLERKLGVRPSANPEATDRVPGGSSGGSAAAVAAGLAVASLGTDTGGSIRQPGSFCGVPAMMGSYGRVSRYGLIAFASSLDRIGPFANNVRDVATVLQIIAGRDPQRFHFHDGAGAELRQRKSRSR